MDAKATALGRRLIAALVFVPLGVWSIALLSAAGCGADLSQSGGLDLGTGVKLGLTAASDGVVAGVSASQADAVGGVTSVGDGAVVGQSGNPVLYVTVQTLDFGEALTRLMFAVCNRGSGVMAYSISSDVAWLTATPASGSSAGGYGQIAVVVNRASLPAGNYSSPLNISTDDGQSQAVTVTMRVAGTPVQELELSTSALNFGGADYQRSFTLRNIGGGSLAYTIESDVAWLSFRPAAGVLTTQTDTINVVADRSQQVTGQYEGHLTVRSAGRELGTTTVSMEKPLTSTLLIPWIELPDGQPQFFTPTVNGLRLWRRVTNTAIVSTDPGHAFLYTDLHVQVPDMRIIPGVKTYPRLGTASFDSVEGWQLLAADVAAILATSGERTVVFEHESALNSYWDGTATIDFAKLRQGLAYLPRDVEYIWYPGLPWVIPDKRERALALAAAVQDVVTVRFTDHSYATPEWPTFACWVEARQMLEALSDRPPVPIVWTYCCGSFCYWEPEQARDMLAALAGRPDVLVYPGGNEWSECAVTMNAVLWPPPPAP